MSEKSTIKVKKPLPGYRFLFATFGVLLIAVGCWSVYGLLTSPSKEVPWWSWTPVISVLRIILGGIYVYYARLLGEATLTRSHWKLGFVVLLLGIFSVWGIFMLFMLLIWTDDDTKAHFRNPDGSTLRKIPLPGFRFLFIAFGLELLVISSITLASIVMGSSELSWFTAVAVLWFILSFFFIGFSVRLHKPDLTERHWRFGRWLIIGGFFLGLGWPFIAMNFIWKDDDTLEVFAMR